MEEQQIGWIAAIIIGGIAGWLAEQFMKSQMGLVMNIVLGIISATPRDGQRPCTLAEDPGRTQPRAAHPRRCSSNASGLPGRNSARILGIRASFQRDNLRRRF
jgi:hypothetical protein